MIVRNAARCTRCNTVIESTSVHDFQQCECGACFVDGGKEYLRHGGDPGVCEDLSVVVRDGSLPGPKE